MKTTRRMAAVSIIAALIAATAACDQNSTSLRPASQSNFASPAAQLDAVDAFKSSLPGILNDNPLAFRLRALAGTLSEFRVGGYAVCAEDEITASQYIELAELDEQLAVTAPTVAAELNSILSDAGFVSDCQFRVLQAAVSSHLRR